MAPKELGFSLDQVGPILQAEIGPEIADLELAPRAITMIHHGGVQTIGDAWQALSRYVEKKGYLPPGRCREVYLDMPMDDPDGWVTELQQPVADPARGSPARAAAKPVGRKQLTGTGS